MKWKVQYRLKGQFSEESWRDHMIQRETVLKGQFEEPAEFSGEDEAKGHVVRLRLANPEWEYRAVSFEPIDPEP